MSASSSASGSGSIFSAVGAIKQGQGQQAAANYNASMMEHNADVAKQEGELLVNRQQATAGKTIGAARASYSASGIDSGQGSALDVIQNSAQQAALDSMLIKYNADSKAYSLQKSAQLTRFEGDTAMDNGYLSAAGNLLSGAGAVAGAM